MRLFTLGTSHGAAELHRACSMNLIEVSGKYYLFDCGGSAESRLVDIGIDPTLLRAVVISHMHEDHVGSITGIVKRFTSYNPDKRNVRIFMPDAASVDALRTWLSAINIFRWQDGKFLTEEAARLSFSPISEGVIFDDGNLRITAIPTRHLANGAMPSFAFVIEGEGKRVLYTADLNPDFSDYPRIAYEKDFDLILSELVHFDVARNLPDIARSRTRKLVFTHYNERSLRALRDANAVFPFEVCVANDGDEFNIV